MLWKLTNVSSVDHFGLEELEPADISVSALEVDHLPNLGQFFRNEGRVGVALAMHQIKNRLGLLPAVFLGEPTRRLGHEQETKEEQDSREHLETPWNSEGGSAVDLAATVADEEHDHDTPCDGPLLHTNQPSTLGWRRQLGDVDGDLRGADAYTETIDDTSGDEHGDVYRGATNNGTDDPRRQSVRPQFAHTRRRHQLTR